MTATPAQILAKLLVDRGVGVAPPPGTGLVGVTDGKMPDDGDRWVSCFNVGAVYQGVLMSTGERIRKPKVAVNVRDTTDRASYNLAQSVQAVFDSVLRTNVTVEGVVYKLQAVMVTLSPAYLGQEQKNSRYLYSLNARVTFVPGS